MDYFTLLKYRIRFALRNNKALKQLLHNDRGDIIANVLWILGSAVLIGAIITWFGDEDSGFLGDLVNKIYEILGIGKEG